MNRKHTQFINFKVEEFLFLGLLLLSSSLFYGCSHGGRFQSVNAQTVSTEPTKEVSQTESNANTNDISISGIRDNVDEGLILPGKSIGQLNLGDSKEFAISYLGKPTEVYPYVCGQVHWNDYKLDNSGIFIYQKDDKIYHIESFTGRFKTINGIKPDDSPKNLMNFYPNLEAYELLKSGAIINGGKNIIYWVDKDQGIAFGIYYYPKKKQRRIGSIIIFNSQEEFQPNGCLSPPQEIVSRKKWYLD